MSDNLLSTCEVADLLGVRRETVSRWHNHGDFPKPLRISPTVLRWRRADVDAWLDRQYDQPASAPSLSRPMPEVKL